MAEPPREPEGESAEAGQTLARQAARSLPIPAPRGSDRALGPVDTLSAYMSQLAHYPPITREEEHELAVRWVEEGDPQTARRLVLSNLRLVVKIAMEYRRAWVNVLDLIQDGNLGLLEAVQRFDPYKGVKLSTYAAYWIRAYILKYILDNFRIVRLGTTRAQRKLFFRLNKEKRALERQGFDVEPALLAERLDVSEAEVVDMDQRLSKSDLSTNAPARRDESDGAEFGDFLTSRTPSAEATVADAELRAVFKENVEAFAETLEERDRKLLDERVLADEPKTLAVLGEELGVSRERIRQLEVRIVDRLREYMREKMVDFEYYAGTPDD
jgi:RNA polymerase sigma-32 factor